MVLWRFGGFGFALVADVPDYSEGRSKERHRTEKEDAVQNSHRGEDNSGQPAAGSWLLVVGLQCRQRAPVPVAVHGRLSAVRETGSHRQQLWGPTILPWGIAGVKFSRRQEAFLFSAFLLPTRDCVRVWLRWCC